MNSKIVFKVLWFFNFYFWTLYFATNIENREPFACLFYTASLVDWSSWKLDSGRRSWRSTDQFSSPGDWKFRPLMLRPAFVSNPPISVFSVSDFFFSPADHFELLSAMPRLRFTRFLNPPSIDSVGFLIYISLFRSRPFISSPNLSSPPPPPPPPSLAQRRGLFQLEARNLSLADSCLSNRSANGPYVPSRFVRWFGRFFLKLFGRWLYKSQQTPFSYPLRSIELATVQLRTSSC